MHHRYHDSTDDLRDQLESLRGDIAALQKQMTRQGRSAYRSTRQMSEDAADWMRGYADALPDLRDSAYRVQRSAQKHPTAAAGMAAAGLAVLGLAAVFLMRR